MSARDNRKHQNRHNRLMKRLGCPPTHVPRPCSRQSWGTDELRCHCGLQWDTDEERPPCPHNGRY